MPVTVLIADDSPFMLKLLENTIKTDPNLKIIGIAKRGVECITQVITKRPRVVILDIMLPDESGLNIVYQIMRARPTAVLLFSSLTAEKVKQDSLVFNYGIVDFISKPPADVDDPVLYLRKVLLPKVHTLAKLTVSKFRTMISTTNDEFLGRMPIHTAKAVSITKPSESRLSLSKKAIIIGASTGGPGALSELFPMLPDNLPPIIVVQHMPAGFIESFASRLDRCSKIKVEAASNLKEIKPGHAYIAQGGKHLVLEKSENGKIICKLEETEMVNFVRPSVDVTLISAVPIFKDKLIVVIMTGMGKDGLQGAKLAKKYGAKVIAQSEADSVIFGMNKAVIDAGIVDKVAPIKDLAKVIVELS